MRDSGQYRGIRNLVTVEMQNRQHCAIADRIQKFVGVQGRSEWASFRFPVAHDHCDDEIRIIEGRAESMRQAVAELAAFMNRTRRVRRAMTADAAREKKTV